MALGVPILKHFRVLTFLVLVTVDIVGGGIGT